MILTNQKDETYMNNIDFSKFEERENVVMILFNFNETVEELEDNNAEREDIEAVFTDEKISELFSDLYDNVDANLDTYDVLYMDYLYSFQRDPEKLEQASASNLSEIENLGEFWMCVKFIRLIPADVLNEIFLSMDDYGFTAWALNKEGDLVKQQYDFGVYETGYFSVGAEEEYINSDLDLYNFAKKKLNVE